MNKQDAVNLCVLNIRNDCTCQLITNVRKWSSVYVSRSTQQLKFSAIVSLTSRKHPRITRKCHKNKQTNLIPQRTLDKMYGYFLIAEKLSHRWKYNRICSICTVFMHQPTSNTRFFRAVQYTVVNILFHNHFI